MRYYCESADSLNHTSRSIALFENQLARIGSKPPTSVLDLGCGNGRNSLHIAKKYGASVTLVDKDQSMLNWAKEQFANEGLSTAVTTLCLPVEELAVNHLSSLASPWQVAPLCSQKYDVVIFSYAIQHIDPAYYPLVLDFCKSICKGFLLLDVFWNPSRVMEGERISFGDVDWYGLSYEELATMISPRFRILSDSIMKNDIAVVINMALTLGETPLEKVLSKQFEYLSGKVRRRGTVGSHYTIHRRVSPTFNFKDLNCVKLLESLYPDRFDFVKSELEQWIQENRRVSVLMLAAKFLWLCRSNRIPVMLKEVSDDFHIRSKTLLGILSATSYIPSLQSSEYVERISRQLQLGEFLEDEARRIVVADGLTGGSPAVRACCAILKIAKMRGIKLTMERLATTANVTPTAVRNAEKRTIR